VYEIEVTAEGLRHLDKLPETVRHVAMASMFMPISGNPNRLGKPLVGELEGLWSAQRGDYRVQSHDCARSVRETLRNHAKR